MNTHKLTIAVLLIALGTLGRFFLIEFVGIPNLEIVTSLALLSGIFIGGIYSIVIPLSVIFLSDVVIGNNGIFIFTWSAFAIIGLIGLLYGKKHKPCAMNSILLAIVSSVFFFAYTNFGWWLMSGMYEYSLDGLIRCYVAAIPFFRNNLIGNLLFVPASIYVMKRIFIRLNSKISFLATVFTTNKQ